MYSRQWVTSRAGGEDVNILDSGEGDLDFRCFLIQGPGKERTGDEMEDENFLPFIFTCMILPSVLVLLCIL